MPKENKDKQLSDKQNYRQKIIELIEKIENQKSFKKNLSTSRISVY